MASAPISPRVLISGIDRKLQGQLNALLFRALVRPERLQTAPQSLRGLRSGDLTPKSALGDHCSGEGAAPHLPEQPCFPLLRLAVKEGLSCSEHAPDRNSLEATSRGVGAESRVVTGHTPPPHTHRGRSQERVSWTSTGPEASARGSPGAVILFLRICCPDHPPTYRIPQSVFLYFCLSCPIRGC